MPEWILQALILGTSIVAQYLYAFESGKTRRPAYIITLCAQPIWIWTSIRHKQWAIFLLSFWFAYNSIRGIRNHWQDDKPRMSEKFRRALERGDWYLVEKNKKHV